MNWNGYKGTSKNGLSAWKHPDGLTIREMINQTGGKDYNGYYRVTTTKKLTGDKKVGPRQFPSFKKATEYAEGLLNKRLEGGTSSFVLTVEQTKEAEAAFNKLKDTDLSLTEIVDNAIKQWNQSSKSVELDKAVEEMLTEKSIENLRAKSIKSLSSPLKTLVKILGNKKVCDITIEDMKGVLYHEIKNLAPKTRNNYLENFTTFFNWCKGKEYITKSPVSSFKKIKIDWEPPVILTVDEVKRLVSTALYGAGRFDHLHLVYLTLGLFVGIRSEEMSSKEKDDVLEWRDIDLDKGIVKITARVAKKRKVRDLKIPPNALALLRLSPVKTGKVIPMKRYEKQIAAFRKRCGFNDWQDERSNAMRHSFGSYFYRKAGNTIDDTIRALGHDPEDKDTLFNHYREFVTEEATKAFWSIKPNSLDRPDLFRLSYTSKWWKRGGVQDVFLP